MGKKAIVTGGTGKDVAAMGTLALNIQKIMPHIADELVIFHDGIKKKDRELIQSIFPTRFIEFSFPIAFRDMRSNRSLRYFSTMIFCKYECLKLLDEYEKVMWTDYDVVILKDIYELWEKDSGLTITEVKAPVRHMFLDSVDRYDMKEFDLDKYGVGTQIFIATKAIGDYKKYHEWCVSATKKYAGCINLPEQCILSMAIQKFEIPYTTINVKKYACPVDEENVDIDSVSILHCYGRPKFWEGRKNIYWEPYYNEWLSMGGSRYRQPFKERLIKIKENIKARLK